MAFVDRIRPLCIDIVNEMKVAHRNPTWDAIAWANNWDTFRLAQSPPLDDNPANRRGFAKDVFATHVNNMIRTWRADWKRRGDDEQDEMDETL